MRLQLIALAGLAAGIATFQEASSRPSTPPARTSVDEETELDKRMLAIKAEVRSLRRSLRDAEQQAASLESLHKIQVAALEAKVMEPRRAASLEEQARRAMTLAYRQEMIRFVETALAAEKALLAGDAEAAKAAFDGLRGQEDPAHERFTEDG